jgi:two-component system, chemotaxis family, protein-glutamate methylesterase/glutaminase
MPKRDIVVIGGSAGAISALRTILAGLPVDYPAALFVVVHSSAEGPGMLPRVLSRSGPLPAEAASDGDVVRAGRIYVAPPDHHLLLERGHMRVTRGPRENRVRPAVDPLFRTAAMAHGPRVIGVILSGGQDDGVLGLSYIRKLGGVTVAQDPAEADAPGMPESAIRLGVVDHVLPAGRIAGILAELTGQPADEAPLSDTEAPRDIALSGGSGLEIASQEGPPSPFTCPECGGALWELREGELIRFQCHVGHSFGGDGLVTAQSAALEAALWSALRALEEAAALRRRMAGHARGRNMHAIAADYEEQAQDSGARATSSGTFCLPSGPCGPRPGEPDNRPSPRESRRGWRRA